MFIKEGPVVRERVGNAVDNTCYIYLLNDCIFSCVFHFLIFKCF